MTVSTSSSSVIEFGNGVATSFNIPFIGVSASDIQVIYTNTAGISAVLTPAQCTLSLNAPAPGALWGVGGSVTVLIGGLAPAIGTSITITRVVPLTQTTSISNQGDFNPQVIESALDTLEFQIQQVAARGGAYRGTWASGVVYNFGDIVQDGASGAYTNNLYVCVNANTSSTWAADLASGDWSLSFSAASLNNTVGYLPTSGGTISGNLTVSGTLTAAGTGLTGTAASLNIGGNAATATTATSATNATNATTATNATNVTGTVASGATGTTQAVNDISTKLATTAFTNPANSIATSGYQKMASGLILQWGVSGSIGPSSSGFVTLPITFPTAAYAVTITPSFNATGAQIHDAVTAFSTSAFTIQNNSGGTGTFYWMATGK